MSDSDILQPLPRRPFAATPSSRSRSASPARTTDPNSPTQDLKPRPSGPYSSSLEPQSNGPSRTHSVLNLTSSTLLGIYSPTGYDTNQTEPSTPWGTGAETPIRRDSLDGWPPSSAPTSPQQARIPAERRRVDPRRHSVSKPHPIAQAVTITLRTLTLFGFGLAYGIFISHLHENQYIAPVPVENSQVASWLRLFLWGVAGIIFGHLLPYVDSIWENPSSKRAPDQTRRVKRSDSTDSVKSLDVERGIFSTWHSILRGLGAFVGIAFAIRRTPWESTLQLSLTLALVNPVLWYLLDRSRSGFVLSFLVGTLGALFMLVADSPLVPSPLAASGSNHLYALGLKGGQSRPSADAAANVSFNPHENASLSHSLLDHILSFEALGNATWLASVLFCSCICFGNIGRRLASARTYDKAYD